MNKSIHKLFNPLVSHVLFHYCITYNFIILNHHGNQITMVLHDKYIKDHMWLMYLMQYTIVLFVPILCDRNRHLLMK